MRYARLMLAGLAALALLGLRGLPADDGGPAEAIWNWPDSTPGVIDSISIDGSVADNSPNGPLGAVVPCFYVSIGGTAIIDIVIDEVDPTDLVTGFEMELDYVGAGSGAINVTGVDTAGQMITANAGSVHVAGSDPVPDTGDGTFRIAADDIGPAPSSAELGEGVLARIEVMGVTSGVGAIWLRNATVRDQNGASIPITKLSGALNDPCTPIDPGIMAETVTGPREIGIAGGDYLIEKMVRNDSAIVLDGELTTEIVPPAECDAGSGLGNVHTIVTDLPSMPVMVTMDVDVPFNVQCPLPGVYDSDFQITNEIVELEETWLDDMNPANNFVLHEDLPGAPPPLTLTPAESPGPALRVHVMNCPSEPPWPAPPGDGDCDGFTDSEEAFMATDSADACPDDLGDDAWPADMAAAEGYGKHDGTVNILDIVQITPPAFGTSPPDANYSERKDLNGDGTINILDIVRLTPPVFGQSCTP